MKELSLHITDVCNFRCRFCLYGDTLVRGPEQIPWEQLESFLVEHQGQGYAWVNLHGGEPTMRKDLFELLALIRRLGYPAVSLQTNGWALAHRGFTRRLADAGVSLFVVSVHGATPEVHDDLAGAAGSLERLLRGMAHVRSLGLPLRTNTVITRANYRTLPAVAELVIGAGASHVNFSTLMPSGHVEEIHRRLMPTFGQIVPPVVEAVELAEGRGAEATLEGFPLCTVPGYEDRCLLRLPETGEVIRCMVRGNVLDNHDSYVMEQCKSKRAECSSCAHLQRCGGVYTGYVAAHGWSELQPVAA
jgi:MoaA/NifB/PqqE/SkfB family radical SAM enzyme